MDTYPYSLYKLHRTITDKKEITSETIKLLKSNYCHFCLNNMNIDSYKLPSRIIRKIKKMNEKDINKPNNIKLGILLRALIKNDLKTLDFVETTNNDIYNSIINIHMTYDKVDDIISEYINYYNHMIKFNNNDYDYHLKNNISCDLCGSLSCDFHQEYGKSKIITFKDDNREIKKYVCHYCIEELDIMLEE